MLVEDCPRFAPERILLTVTRYVVLSRDRGAQYITFVVVLQSMVMFKLSTCCAVVLVSFFILDRPLYACGTHASVACIYRLVIMNNRSV